jgi:hypothetical protein
MIINPTLKPSDEAMLLTEFLQCKNSIMIIYQGETYGNNERPIGVWSTLRTPNKKMESKNEKIHFWC